MPVTRGWSARVDVSPPCAGGLAPGLDELLEPFQVALDLVVVDVDGGADLLGDAGRLPVDLDHHPGLVLAEPVEGDDTSVLGLAAAARPGNALIGVLLGDLGFELALAPGNVVAPVVALLAPLPHRLPPPH